MSSLKRLLLTLLPILLFGWLAFYCYSTGRLILSSFNRSPEVDYWELVPHIRDYLALSPRPFWAQHYEHRVTFPEVIFALDWIALKGRGTLPLFLNVSLNVGTWLIFCSLLRRTVLNRSLSQIGLLFSAILLFWPGTAFVLAFPFSLQWLLCQFASVMSLWMLSKQRVYATLLFATIASFSSANGLFLWIALPFLAWFSLNSFFLTGVFVCEGICVTLVYALGYHNFGNAHPAIIFEHTAKFSGYFLSYLGMPFGASHFLAGLAAGAASLLGTGFAVAISRRRKLQSHPIVIVCLGIIVFTLITAFVTSLSRIPVQRSFQQAIEIPGRYVLFGCLFWAALVTLYLLLVDRIWPTHGWIPAVIGVLGCLMVLHSTQPWMALWMSQYPYYQIATLSVEAGIVNDAAALTLNCSDGRLVKTSLAELKERRLSLYSWDDYRLPGQQLNNISNKNMDMTAQIAVTNVQKVDGGVQLVGWASPQSALVLIVDKSDTIIGLGRHLPAGMPAGLPPPPGQEREFWVGFANSSFDAATARYIVTR